MEYNVNAFLWEVGNDEQEFSVKIWVIQLLCNVYELKDN